VGGRRWRLLPQDWYNLAIALVSRTNADKVLSNLRTPHYNLDLFG
jgi:hypothetical protein